MKNYDCGFFTIQFNDADREIWLFSKSGNYIEDFKGSGKVLKKFLIKQEKILKQVIKRIK